VRDPDEHITEDLSAVLDGDPIDPRPRRRRLALIAAAGLTVAVGGGAFALTRGPDTNDPAPVAGTRANGGAGPAGTSGDPVPSAAPSGSHATQAAQPDGAAASPTASRLRTPKPATTSYRAGADTSEPRAVVADVPVTTVSSGSPKEGRTLKVVSARGDLSHEREMVWAADQGEAVGEARCTQNFKISFSAPVTHRPTMLLCWRLSSTRSAYSLMVDLHGKPSRTDSVAALDKAWNKLA
jgi:hypothetical protein